MILGRASVKDIADLSGLHGNTIRRWSDSGLIHAKKDFRGRRWFPNPAETIKRINDLMLGKVD